MSDVDDERTTVTRSVPGAPDPVDEDTVVTAKTDPFDETTTTSRHGFDEATRVSRRDLDEATVVRGGREVADAGEETVVRRTAADEETVVRATPAPAGAPRGVAPGRLSGGRVAFVPTDSTERYSVRASAAEPTAVVRTVIPAPVSPTRQSRDTSRIEAGTTKARRKSGAGVVIAIAVVTVLTVAVVAGVIVVAFLL